MGTGTLTLNPDRTGRADFTVSSQGPGGVTVPFSKETFYFVITKGAQEIYAIGGAATGPNGEELGGLSVKAIVTRQNSGR